MSPLALFVLGTLLAAAVMAVVFGASVRVHNFSVVDVAWSANFTLLVVAYASLADGYWARRALLAVLVTAWSLRLAAHLLARVVALHPEEDGRYVQLRHEWAARRHLRFFAFFQAQGLSNAALSIPFVIACVDPRAPLGAFEMAGAALAAVAVAGEALADRQLARFKADPANRGRTCRAGLWRYSRHPNYFFEWLVWVAWFVYALPSPWGWTSAVGPVVMLLFLWRVTGIPMTEQQALRSRGEDYREYQRSTSPFFPWPPRR